MLKIFLFVVIAAVQCMELQDKLNKDHVAESHLSAQQGQPVDDFSPRFNWGHYYPSWSLPSMSTFFKDYDYEDNSPILLKKIASLEKKVAELGNLLKKHATDSQKQATHTTPNNKVELRPSKESTATAPVDKASDIEKKPEAMDKPAEPENQQKIPDQKPTEISDKPKTPETSNKPKTPETSNKPKPPETSDEPKTPETSDTPTKPEETPESAPQA